MAIEILHLKLLFWGILAIVIVYLIVSRRDGLSYKFHEINTRVRTLGGATNLNSEFTDDLESGLHSSNFDIISNNQDDPRAGLDDESKKLIRDIMVSENVSFDKARLIFTERKFDDNDIASDGRPLDPKAVTFSS